MKLQDFHVVHADWSRDSEREALRGIRVEVFMQEQGVPESLEWDELDATSVHLLACGPDGEPIGCARLTTHGKIGRMAVRQPWRSQGVGGAILRAMIERARTLGRREIILDAQLPVLAFYEREGFIAYGETFEDAGIMHRAMRLDLGERPGADAAPDATSESEHLPTGSRSEIAASRLQLLAETSHRLAIYQPLLTDEVYASPNELAELRRIATSGRGAQIRLLVHDPATALRDSHRLIALAQRVPSIVQVRTPVDEVDLAYGSSYLLTDQGGYIFQPDAQRASGRGAAHDRAAQAPLMQHFNEVWERSARATVLHPLDL